MSPKLAFGILVSSYITWHSLLENFLHIITLECCLHIQSNVLKRRNFMPLIQEARQFPVWMAKWDISWASFSWRESTSIYYEVCLNKKSSSTMDSYCMVRPSQPGCWVQELVCMIRIRILEPVIYIQWNRKYLTFVIMNLVYQFLFPKSSKVAKRHMGSNDFNLKFRLCSPVSLCPLWTQFDL